VPPRTALNGSGLVFYSGGHGPDAAAQSFKLQLDMHAALATTHIDTMHAAALVGQGVTGQPSLVIEDAPVEHALERVWPERRLFDVTLCAGMPSPRHLPARTRAFVDFLLQVLGGGDRDPGLSAAGGEAAVGQPIPA
jgi:DNA-binding transcriptional LysR family regulator